MSSLWSTALISAFIAPASLASQQSHNVTPHQGIAEVTWLCDFEGSDRVTTTGDWIIAGQSLKDYPGHFQFIAFDTQTNQKYDIGKFRKWTVIGETAVVGMDGDSPSLWELDRLKDEFVETPLMTLPEKWSPFWIGNQPWIHWITRSEHGSIVYSARQLRYDQPFTREIPVSTKTVSVNGPFIVRQDDSTIQFTDVRTGYDSAVITLGHPIKYMVLSPGKEFALIKLKNENHPLILLDTHTQLDQKHIVQGSENIRDLFWVDQEMFGFSKGRRAAKLRCVQNPNLNLNDDSQPSKKMISSEEWKIGSKLSLSELLNNHNWMMKPNWVLSGGIRAHLKWT